MWKRRERVNWPNLIEGFRCSPDLCGQLQRVRAPVSYTQVSFHGQFTCLNTNQYRLCAVPRLGINFFFFRWRRAPAASALRLSLFCISRMRWRSNRFFFFTHSIVVHCYIEEAQSTASWHTLLLLFPIFSLFFSSVILNELESFDFNKRGEFLCSSFSFDVK